MTVYDFWAPWCGPCKSFAPILDKVAEKRNLQLVKVNTEDDTENIAKMHKIRSIPTVVVTDDEGNEIGRFVGTKSENDLNEFFDNISE